MRRTGQLLKAALLATTLLGATSALAQPGAFERTPDGVIVTPATGSAKRVRLQVMSDSIIHVTATPDGGFDLPPSLMVIAKPEGGGFQLVQQGDEVELKTGKAEADVSLATGQVQFRNAAGEVVLAEQPRAPFRPVTVEGHSFYAVRQEFNPGTSEGFFGLGQHQNRQMNYNGEDVELSQYNRDIAVPFVVSTRDYGVLWDNNAISRFGNPVPYALASRDLKIFDADGKPGGFTASYYLGDRLVVRRLEPDVDYQWLADLPRFPAELKGKPNQRVVWEGYVAPSVGGVQRFKAYSSDYAKVWVDGKLVIDRWRQSWNPWFHNFDAPMAAGSRHKIRIEWRPSGGHFALLHNNPMPQADRHSLYLTSDLAKAIDYYFISGDSMDEVIAGYRKLTGPAVLLPRWAYGFWQSRQRYETQAQLLGVVEQYRKLGLPLDNIVQDWLYWPQDAWGSHRFDPARYPDPKAMVDDIHRLHAHLMVSIWPKFYTTTENYKELAAAGHIYPRTVQLGVKDWVGPGYVNGFYDAFSKDARDIYWRQVRDNLRKLDIDAWWMDADEPDMQSNNSVHERELRMDPTALGPGASVFNAYSLEHTTGVFQGERAYDPDRRSFILSRSGFGGLQRNGAAVWSGDTAARWDDLHDQISAGVNLSMSGIPNWTMDIGGFSTEPRYQHPDAAARDEWRELNLRWFQFGAFAPLFRSHGEAPFREIYTLAPVGSPVYEALAASDRLRYRLMPYTLTLAGDTYWRNGTIMRGLVMDFPTDHKAWDVDDEYLYGPALLVAPVYQYKARSRPVYLPAGANWYDFYTGKRFAGGQTIAADAPLARMPLFVKAGSIVPTGPAVQWVGEKPDAPVTLFVYTGTDGSFSLYEDDGLTNAYARGAWSRIPITWDQASRTLTLSARTGSYAGMKASRTFDVRWISGPSPQACDFAAAPDQTVAYDGRAVSVREK